MSCNNLPSLLVFRNNVQHKLLEKHHFIFVFHIYEAQIAHLSYDN